MPRLGQHVLEAQVVDQTAAVRDSDHLQPATHAQQRQSEPPGRAHQAALRTVAVRVRADVFAARQHHAVHHVEHVERVDTGAGREDHRAAAGSSDRVDVRRRHAADGERAPEPLDVVPGAGDPDDRAAHTASTSAVTARAIPEA